MFIDTHCHLDILVKENKPQDAFAYISRAKEQNVSCMITIGSTPERSHMALEIAKHYDGVYASLGVHPDDVYEDYQNDLSQFETLAQEYPNKVVAIGECGLDYYNTDGRKNKPKELQKELFIAQIDLANRVKLPLVIHTREADDDTIEILTAYPPKYGFVIHCYTAGPRLLQTALSFGGYIGFTGIVSFPKAQNVRDRVNETPMDRMLIETDAPFLAPVPMRGKQNEPSYVPYIAQYIADMRNIPLQDFVSQTTNNAQNLFFAPK